MRHRARRLKRHTWRFSLLARRAVLAIERAHYRRFLVSVGAGMVVLGAMMWIPAVNHSFVGAPDRQMMTMAFKIRAEQVAADDPALLIDIDDSTIVGTLPASGPPRAPLATAPRGVVAKVLDYILHAPPGQGAKVVIVDVDFATPTPGDEAGAAELHKVLAEWAQTPSAPPLLLGRQSFPASAITSDQTPKLLLPATDYDDVVDPAPNIYWVIVKMLSDENSVIREFRPYECDVRPDGKMAPVFSAPLMAYAFMVQGKIPNGAPVSQWTKTADADCAGPPHPPIQYGEFINYHLELGEGENENRVWPDMPANWPGASVCGPNADRAVFRRLSAGDVAAAGPDADHGLLCQRLVVVGGTNQAANDFEQTPFNDMSGPVILINAARGLEMSDGGLKRVPLWLQLTTLIVMSALITVGFWAARKLREHYEGLRSRHRERPLIVRLRLLPFNPVLLSYVFAFTAYAAGVGLLIVSLNLGYWGYLSAPAFASAVVGSVQEFSNDED